jgi:ferredoxin-NADP reductase/MOSC domain-containing protein YiiM
MSVSSFGTLLSVNAGQASPMTVQGETVVTGFDKRPTGAPGRIEAGGLVGDDHVDDAQDLDRSVLLYQRHHYEAWSRELGRDLAPGTFGEQLTIDGPAEDEVLVGDVVRVGEVLLEVTQPRIPCRKMAVRLGVGDMPARYMRTGRVGFFCKVLQAGQVRPGDGIELVRRGPDGLTVARLAGVLHRDEPDAAELDGILSATVLPGLVRAKLTRIQARLAAREQSWTGDRPLAVCARVPHGTEVVAFDLADPAGERLPDFQAGQFLTLTLDIPGAQRPVVRTYTVAGRGANGLGYRIAVKREPAPRGSAGVPPGRASGHLHDNVVVGTTLSARAPRGRFVLQPGERPVVLVSAGIGITPMIAMLEELARQEGREVFFVHGARSSRELAFGKHVRGLVAAAGPRLHTHLTFSQPQLHDVLGTDFDAVGRLTCDVLEQVLPGLGGDFYVCGPLPFMADIVSGLLDRQVPGDCVHYEFFGAATSLFGDGGDGGDGPAALDAEGHPILVTFARSGVTVPWRENSFSLLSLAEQAGLRPDASCRAGLCNTCVCRIDDGEVEYAIEPMDAITPGKVAVCCARPRTSVMIDL